MAGGEKYIFWGWEGEICSPAVKKSPIFLLRRDMVLKNKSF
jgi:hypothetical protein